MNEVELTQKLDAIVKLAQSRILNFLRDYTNAETIKKVNEVFNKYPILLVKRKKK